MSASELKCIHPFLHLNFVQSNAVLSQKLMLKPLKLQENSIFDGLYVSNTKFNTKLFQSRFFQQAKGRKPIERVIKIWQLLWNFTETPILVQEHQQNKKSETVKEG